MSRLAATLALFAVLSPAPALAHSGGLDAQGCHVNRKTGERHCHRSSAPKQAVRGSTGSSRLIGSSDQYPNCAAVRAAGAAPIRVGEAGYGRHLDRDNDGVGCER